MSNAKTAGIRAFTLVELMVTLLIISILAAIIFPVLTSSKKRALQATCSSNEEQIARACLLYRSRE